MTAAAREAEQRDLSDIRNDIREHNNSIVIGKIRSDPSLIYCVDFEMKWSLLAYAMFYKKNDALIDFLLENMKHDVLIGNSQQTSIMFCITFGNRVTLQKLIDKFKDTIDHVDKNGYCALLDAIMDEKHEKVQMLLHAGADRSSTENALRETLTGCIQRARRSLLGLKERS